MPRKVTTEDIVSRCREVHGDKYDYSKSEYKGIREYMTIICPKHGEFQQKPQNHYKLGQICKQCYLEDRYHHCRVSRVDLVEKLSNNVRLKSKGDVFKHKSSVTVECDIHGKYETCVASLMNKQSCGKCRKSEATIKRSRMSKEEFITRANVMHGGKYSYERVRYEGAHRKVKVTCPVHGDFKVRAWGHLYGSGCTRCTERVKELIVEGKTFIVRGYEGTALRYMIAAGVNPNEIVGEASGRVPKIDLLHPYRLGERKVLKSHYPDFYLPRRNMIVEVKSVSTFGFAKFHYSKKMMIELNQLRARSAKAAGYNYRCLIFRYGKLIALPKNWENMKAKELYAWYKRRA